MSFVPYRLSNSTRGKGHARQRCDSDPGRRDRL